MPDHSEEIVLTSGHRVVASNGSADPHVHIVGPAGDLQLSITLTPAGPLVRLQAASIELSASQSLSLNAPDIHIRSSQSLALEAGGDIALDGRTVLLNCAETEDPHHEPPS
ncbi:MAG: hypothetical protein M9913_20910 [Bryobacteraceae bacterium]|nr:hypothetical protein [Solibacteraceae bacterium]MCO5353309.1 hypothetical protein [Bryobacteraceae bacterium]